MKLFFYFLILLLGSHKLSAQDPYAIKVNSKETTFSNEIFDVIKDSKGFIWTASSTGLSKYDGASLTTFSSDEQSTISGSSLKEDIYGRIWYENFDGYLFYTEGNRLKKLNQNTPVGFIPFGITDKYLFVIQTNGIDIYDIKSLKLIKNISLQFVVAEHACLIGDSYYFIADDILYKIDSHFQLKSTNYFTDKHLHVKYIFPEKNGFYILSKLNETQKIYYFDENLNLTNTKPLANINYIQGSTRIDDYLWIYTPNGTFAYNYSSKDALKAHYYKQKSISKIIKDDNYNFWFSSTNQGLFVVPNLNDILHTLPKESVSSISDYGTKLLIGTQSGALYETDNTFSTFEKKHQINENLPTYYIYNDSSSNQTFFSNNGFYWAVNNAFKSAKNYNVALKEVIRIDEHYFAFASSNYCGLLKNKDANKTTSIWDQSFYKNQSKTQPDISLLIRNKRAKSVSFDPLLKNIYFATNTGIYMYNQKGVKEIKNENKSVFASKILHANNRNYVLTTQGNLFELNHKNELIKLNEKYKIADQSVQLIKNINNQLYILNNKNILKADYNQFSVIHHNINSFSIKDFIIKNEYLMVLTNEGVVKSNLKVSAKNANCKPFVIEKVLVNNKPVKWNEQFKTPLRDNYIMISFSILDYISNTTDIYYRINKGTWIAINENVRKLEFPSLAAGNYELEFKIDEQLHPEKIYWQVQLPFWKTWWFYFLSFLIGIICIYAVYRWQYRMMNTQIRLLNEKIHLEKDLSQSVLTSIKSQMNPHFFYNALNTIQAYIFTNEKKKANDYLAKFSKLTRIILEMSEREKISLQEEIQSITLYLELEQMRFSKDFTYEIVFNEKLLDEGIEFPTMLLQPYIENSIKHGLMHSKKEKHLKVLLKKELNYLVVEIDDNGIGRTKAEELNAMKKRMHQSFSTKANQKRLDILNKGLEEKITVKYIDKNEQGIPTGTTVVLTIPIN